MARLRGPLSSVSASGTIGHTITYRATRHGAVAQRPAIPSGPPSEAQATYRQAHRDAAVGYAALPDAERAHWAALAVARGRPAWILYAAEWHIQQVTPGTQPLIPAI